MNDYNFLQGKNLEIISIVLSQNDLELNISINTYIENQKVLVQFRNVSSVKLWNLSYPMIIEYIDIIDHSNRGWESYSRFHVHDLEDENLSFFCQEINITLCA